MNTLHTWLTWRRRLRTWRRPHRLMLRSGAQALSEASAVRAAIQSLSDWAPAHAGSAVELMLSSHFMLMQADSDVHDAATLRQRAVERWAHYLDLDSAALQSDWRLQTTLDLGRAPVAVVCALPKSLIEGLQQVASQHRIKLVAIQPWWGLGFQAAWNALPTAHADQVGEHAVRLWTWSEADWQLRARVTNNAEGWRLSELSWLANGLGGCTELAPSFDQHHEAPATSRSLMPGEVELVDLGPGSSRWKGFA